MNRLTNSVLAKLTPKPPVNDKPLPLPDGLRCLRCTKHVAMCNHACRREDEVKQTARRDEPER